LENKGWTYVFGPQKGVKHEELEETDKLIAKLFNMMKESSPLDTTGLEELEGSGASGGIVAGFKCFFKDCKMQSGIEMISELTGLDDKIKQWDILITGEGMFDNQTLDGKVISRLLHAADLEKKHVIVLCGKSEVDESIIETSYNGCKVSILDLTSEFGKEASMSNPAEWIDNILEKNYNNLFE